MDKDAIRFVKSVLPEGRTLFYDFPDRYALLLLEYALGDTGADIGELKRSPLAKLLEKPCVKGVIADLGGARLTADDLLTGWPQRPEAYRLTLGNWPGLGETPTEWHQTTRNSWNLVLQLNFSITHNQLVKKMVPNWYAPITMLHPVATGKEITLAWSRIDLDLDTGEALIEEIQSDWVRGARWRTVSPYENHAMWKEYVEDVLLPSCKRWPEIMMTATLWFLLKEIGIRQIFYHTFETGSAMKHIDETHPPRSLYTDLPRRFCFQKTHNGPTFVRDSADKELRRRFTDPDTVWHLLEL